MDNEELYDSLEEEFSSASSASLILVKPNLNSPVVVKSNNDLIKKTSSTHNNLQITKLPPSDGTPETIHQNFVFNLEDTFKLNCNVESETDYPKDSDISSMVPLYGGDKFKTEVESFKNSSSKYDDEDNCKGNNNVRRKRRSIFTTHENSQSSCSNLEALVKNKITKSYLDMFHARIGYPGGIKKKEIEDSVRSLFGDSQRSLISDSGTDKDVFKDAEDNCSDTSSFYYKQIEADHKNESLCDLNQTSNASVTTNMPSSKLSSFSEINVSSTHQKLVPKPKHRFKKAIVQPIPVLGGLGPDISANQDKLERRKKQLNYGQKASNRNRIKMMEMKVLKNLKEEIEKSNE